MTSETTKNVRLVRCPKCGRVLQEMPNVPLYQCGGCFTTLQAKSPRQTMSSLPETRADETSNSDHVSEDKTSSGSSHDTTLPCADECHSDHDCEMSQTISGKINNVGNLRGKNTGNQKSHQHDFSTSDEDCLLKEATFLENGEPLYPMSVRTRFRVGDGAGKSSSFVAKVDKAEADIDLNSETGSVYKRSDKGEILDITGESLASDVSVSSPGSSNYKTQQHFSNPAENMAESTHSPLDYSELYEDELLDSVGFVHSGRNWTNEYAPHHSYYKRESLDVANRIPNELYHTANFTSPEPRYADQEKLELLRMVSELQDQLNKATLNHKETGRVNWPHPRRYSHIPMASTGLNSLGYSKGLSMSHSLPSHYDFNVSYPSAQVHVDPRFNMHNSDDQMKRDNRVTRERPQLPKRHLRPLARGAPFITCHSCLKELQLPVDFLLFRKRCHRLKCGACLRLLNFTLVNNTHLVPYTPQSRNFSSTSHMTGCPSVSCSDDSGRPTCKSSSQGNAVDRKFSNEKEIKVNEMKSKGKTPIGYESGAPSTSTSNSKSEQLEKEAERRGSFPLHRLMGYSSAHQVLYN